MRNQIVLILPGITGYFPSSWQNLVNHYEYPSAFQRILKNGSLVSSGYKTLGETLSGYLNLPTQVPWAWFGMRGEGIKTPSPEWIKVDIRTYQGNVVCDERFLKNLALELAQDFPFAENSIVTQSGAWYMSLGEAKQLRSTNLWDIPQQGSFRHTYGLSGVDAPLWRTRFSQAAKWLFEHRINKERIELDLPVFESFWPWGCANYTPFADELRFTALFSDNPIFRGAAAHLGMAAFTRSYATSDLAQMMQNHHSICIIEDSLLNSFPNNIFSDWQKKMEYIDTHILTPCMKALDSGIIDELILEDGLGQRLTCNRRFKFTFKKNQLDVYFRNEEWLHSEPKPVRKTLDTKNGH